MSRMVSVTLSAQEKKALLEMSKQDLRPPWDQVRWLIVEEARRRGLMPDADDPARVEMRK